MKSGVVGLLLAAGQGRRFGSDKLMHRLPDGMPVAVAAASRLLPVCDQVVAVLRPEQWALAEALAALGCECVLCAEAQHGMGHTLAAGIRAAPDAAGWVVALADMPFIQPASHAVVVEAMRGGARLAATRFRGQRGHPAGFARDWRTALEALTGDEGARQILSQHAQDIVWCDVNDEGVVRDIDRPEDLLR